MCGRYAIECEEENVEFKEIIEEINRRYAGKAELTRLKTGEIFPSDIVPVLASADARPFLMRWGIPRWDRKGSVINARSETAMEKKMSRPSLLARRCVIPSTGFYEWARNPAAKSQPTFRKPRKNPPTLFDFVETQEDAAPALSGKDKYLLRSPNSPMLYMAGFFSKATQTGDDPLPSFVILTTDANEWVAPLHDRMPLILDDESLLSWLSDSRAAADFLSRPCSTRLLADLQ
jgi:putative SOS response-associated peptidase YedK